MNIFLVTVPTGNLGSREGERAERVSYLTPSAENKTAAKATSQTLPYILIASLEVCIILSIKVP